MIFLYLIFLSSAAATIVNKCTNSVSQPDFVQINDCEKSPCEINAGTNVTCHLQFQAPRYLEHIKPVATAYVFGVSLNYTLDQTDACDGIINTPCPLAEDEFIDYFFQIQIPSVLPKISLDLEFSLIDEDQRSSFLCFRTSLSVQKRF